MKRTPLPSRMKVKVQVWHECMICGRIEQDDEPAHMPGHKNSHDCAGGEHAPHAKTKMLRRERLIF